MTIGIFTDPHIGLLRAAHTSVRSRKLIQDHLYEHALRTAKDLNASADTVVCVGDLFDRFTNKEEVIAQGGNVADHCDYVLAGNHDMRNDTTSVSSFALLKTRSVDKTNTAFVSSPDPVAPYYFSTQLHVRGDKSVRLWFIPHCFTQEVFVESVRQVCDAHKKEERHYLFLHCNIGEIHGKVEDEGTTLALTDELQAMVSENFDMVLVGHEHSPYVKRKNIVILGNTFPVHFGEMGDRYAYLLNPDANTLAKIKIFAVEEDFRQFTYEELVQQNGDIDVGQRMVEITGEIKAEEYADFSRALQRFWKRNQDTLFAVKNAVTIKQSANAKKSPATSRVTLRDVIHTEATAAGFAAEIAELSAEVSDDN